MPSLAEHLEHARRDARVERMPSADDRDLGDRRRRRSDRPAPMLGASPCRRSRARACSRRCGTVNVRSVRAVLRQVLDDHVDDDALPRASGAKSRAGDARLSGTPRTRILASSRSSVTPETTSRFHRLSSGTTQVPSSVVEARAHVDRHAVLHRESHRADLQHLGAERRQLEHLFVADALDLARRRADVRIGRVDAVDVGVDLADVGLERRRDRDRRGVGAAAPERGDVALLVDALEAGDHGDPAAVAARCEDAPRVDALDARARERAVGADAHLVAGERARLAARALDREREQRDRHLLAGRRRSRRPRARRGCSPPTSRASASSGWSRPTSPTRRRRRGGPASRRRQHAPGDVADALDGADGGAAVFLDDQCHVIRRSAAAELRPRAPSLRNRWMLAARPTRGAPAREQGPRRGRKLPRKANAASPRRAERARSAPRAGPSGSACGKRSPHSTATHGARARAGRGSPPTRARRRSRRGSSRRARNAVRRRGCSCAITKVGLATALGSTPRPSARPFANTVLPAPSGPISATPPPRPRSRLASRRPAAGVASGLRECSHKGLSPAIAAAPAAERSDRRLRQRRRQLAREQARRPRRARSRRPPPRRARTRRAPRPSAASRPCASRPVSIPSSTSPVPPLASAGPPVGFTISAAVRRRGERRGALQQHDRAALGARAARAAPGDRG